MHIILMRGLAREAAHWLDFPEQLQTALGTECQLRLIDFPGCGQFCDLMALKSVAAMTDHARHKMGLPALATQGEQIYLVGISMGGMVALDWAQRFPEELRGVVLINSSTGNQPLWWRLRPGTWLAVACALFSPSRSREAQILKLVSNNPHDYAEHLKNWLRIQQLRPINRSTIISMLRAAAGFHPAPSCALKGLVLASEGDRMVSTRTSEDLAQQFNWPLAKHPSAGHDLPMDDPGWVAEQMNHWIKNQS